MTGCSTKEVTGTAVVFFMKGLSSTVAKALGPFLILHLALFLGLAHSWVRMPLDIIALGFWSCALVAYGHLALVHRLYIAEWRGIPNPPWREPSVAPASVCLPSLALILKIGVTL